ncbi:MAG TPA: PIN domain-containing protein [Acidobacteriota bacterium]|nr:PIN domain-containing protein [Acidobacteriota bacterium]
MILVDAGPLVAIIDRGEADHQACLEALSSLAAPMLTTWPAFTEAVYLLGAAGGWPAQDALWKLVQRGDLRIIELDRHGRQRSRELMRKYRDRPMDLADATLVAAAEAIDTSRIFTLDSDFHVYRLKDKKSFEVIP